MNKSYRYVRKGKRINKKDLETYSSIKQFNKKYYPKQQEKSIQEQFDNAVYNGKIKEAVKILITYHFKKFLQLKKVKLVSHFI